MSKVVMYPEVRDNLMLFKGSWSSKRVLIPKELSFVGYNTPDVKYYPNEDNYVYRRDFNRLIKCMSSNIYTEIDWYNMMVLRLRNSSEAPICKFCEKSSEFIDIENGYREFCDEGCLLNYYQVNVKYHNVENPYPIINYQKEYIKHLGRRSIEYFIPKELIKIDYYHRGSTVHLTPLKGDWVGGSYLDRIMKIVTNGEFDSQSWYDICILRLQSPSQRPRCKNCNSELKFRQLTTGYYKYIGQVNIFCSNSCCASYKNNHHKDYPRFHESLVSSGVFGFKSTFTGSKCGEYYCDSAYERNYCQILESNPRVVKYERPTSIPYEWYDNTVHRYHPDFVVTYIDGSKEVIEIKPLYYVNHEINQLKFNAAEKYYQQNNITFKVVTEVELDELSNKFNIEKR